MVRMQADNKKLIKTLVTVALVMLIGMAFAAASFCIYYLVKPLNTAVIVSLCIVDFLYCFCSMSILFKRAIFGNGEKWLLKSVVLSVIYIVAFLVFWLIARMVINGFYGYTDFLKENIIRIVLYAFFTSPFMILVILLLLAGMYP